MRLYRKRPGGRWYYPAAPRLGVGMSSAIALVGSTVLTLALGWIGELNGGWFALGAYAVLAAVLGAISRAVAAPVIALGCWLFFDGFAVHRYAEVGWDGGIDMLRLGLLAGVALAMSLPGALPRRRIRVKAISEPTRTHSNRG